MVSVSDDIYANVGNYLTINGEGEIFCYPRRGSIFVIKISGSVFKYFYPLLTRCNRRTAVFHTALF